MIKELPYTIDKEHPFTKFVIDSYKEKVAMPEKWFSAHMCIKSILSNCIGLERVINKYVDISFDDKLIVLISHKSKNKEQYGIDYDTEYFHLDSKNENNQLILFISLPIEDNLDDTTEYLSENISEYIIHNGETGYEVFDFISNKLGVESFKETSLGFINKYENDIKYVDQFLEIKKTKPFTFYLMDNRCLHRTPEITGNRYFFKVHLMGY